MSSPSTPPASSPVRYLIGDIGGTNIRLQLHEHDPITDHDAQLADKTYQTKDFTSLTAAVQEFLAQYSPSQSPVSCCLALAGPVANNSCVITNLNWTISGSNLASSLNIPHVQLVNDFVAAGYGCLALPPKNLIAIHEPQRTTFDTSQNAVKAIIGAGTGLGEAFAVHTGSEYVVYPTEGGHSDFAPRTDEEFAVMKHIQQRLGLHHVSVERLVSGTAIPNIYRALKELHPELANSAFDSEILKGDPAANISRHAQDKSCQLCVKTIDTFVALYGSECGNQALKLLPFGGIYIAGGIATKIMWAMQNNQFVANFIDKGRMKPVLSTIPIYVAHGAEVGLLGAKVVAKRLWAQHAANSHNNSSGGAGQQLAHWKDRVTERVKGIVSKL